jgi:signal transduction histidine kinase
MRERAEELGGTYDVSSAPGGGTVVRGRLPFAGAAR